MQPATLRGVQLFSCIRTSLHLGFASFTNWVMFTLLVPKIAARASAPTTSINSLRRHIDSLTHSCPTSIFIFPTSRNDDPIRFIRQLNNSTVYIRSLK